MNLKQNIVNRMRVLSILDKCYNKDINKIKLSSANTWEHEKAKCLVCYQILKAGHNFVTEARFKNNKGRADCFDITSGVIWEIQHSESDESIELKKLKYPKGLDIKVIKI